MRERDSVCVRVCVCVCVHVCMSEIGKEKERKGGNTEKDERVTKEKKQSKERRYREIESEPVRKKE